MACLLLRTIVIVTVIGTTSSFLSKFHNGQRLCLSKPEFCDRNALFLSSTSSTATTNRTQVSTEKGKTFERRDRNPQQRRIGSQQGNRHQGRRRPGGGGGLAMQLLNPMKLQRIVQPFEPRRREPRNRDESDSESKRSPVNRSSPNRRSQEGTASSDRSRTIIAATRGERDIETPMNENGSRRPRRTTAKTGTNTWKKKGDENRKGVLRVSAMRRGRSQVNRRRGSLRRRDRSAEKFAKEEAALERKTVCLPDGPLSVAALADVLEEKPVAVIKYLMTDLGVMASMTQNLDQATCIAVAEGLGRVVGGVDYEIGDVSDVEDEESALSVGYAVEEDNHVDLVTRPPVVTIMGHVDHGKTSLLDAIRNTKVTASEAGGITQHIAAYQVNHKGNPITFIDTPGHAAFTDMRERGANITDMVILVVAADDGVKQQTVDSIACARYAGVPLVVAINKCDLETANPSQVLSELTTYDILTEELGGEVLCCEISAKMGTNLDDLLDKVMLQAELQDLKANPSRRAQGAIVEARLERGFGSIATTLIQKGTIKVGDYFVAGSTSGKVRALIDTDGKTRLKEAGPSQPISVVGFDEIPSAGDILFVVDDEQAVKELAESRQRISRDKEAAQYQASLMSSIATTFGTSMREQKEMCVLVKADVQGTAEALTRALRELKLENEEAAVTVKVLVSETGEVSKSDIAIAGVTEDTTILAFGVAASFDAMEEARANGISIEYHSIIYDAVESIESRMQEVLSPTPEGEYVGSATVQEVFNIGGTGNIAGSRCTDGYLRKGASVRVMRGDKILIESKVKSLRNFKAESDRIEEGNECGIGLLDFEAFEAGDVVECYVEM
mmetsp:Transcript_23009/g.25368  ORF Transcript_23009/g.25368 Transcript_23009/m.25368 type:complete len:844 (-) Transcript_23009:358-2889(-)